MSTSENENNLTAEKAVERNISAVHEMRKESDDRRRVDQKFIDKTAAFAGSTPSLYLHAAFYGTWIGLHLYSNSVGHEILGDSISNISMLASMEAIFLAVFVLINQRRMNALERRNSDLHLQMSLLAEHEVTKLAQMTDLIARHLGVNLDSLKDLEALKKEIDPQHMIDRISRHEQAVPTDSTDNSQLD